MAIITKRKWCKDCEQYRLAQRDIGIGDGMGCLLTIITVGLFLLVWIPLRFLAAIVHRWRCPVCGRSL